MYFVTQGGKIANTQSEEHNSKTCGSTHDTFEFWQLILSQNILKYVRIDLSTTKINMLILDSQLRHVHGAIAHEFAITYSMEGENGASLSIH